MEQKQYDYTHVYPNEVIFPIIIAPESVSPKTTSINKKKEEKKEKKFLGRLSYKLDYDFDRNSLTVTVIQADGLPAMDLGGTSDPYVKLFLLPDKKKKYQTRVQKKSLNPVFNENFMFKKLCKDARSILKIRNGSRLGAGIGTDQSRKLKTEKKIPYNEISSQTLIMSVFDFDRFGKHGQIGEISVPLGKVDLATTIERCDLIQTPPENRLGEVCLALRYVPNKNKLTVVVMECKNLKKMDVLGLSDPYVKIYLMMQKKRLEKKKTTIKMKTLNPYYNESFSFDVSPEKMQRVHLQVTVSDYDRVGSNERIGHVIIGNNANGVALKQWQDVLAAPRRSVAQWHVANILERAEYWQDNISPCENDQIHFDEREITVASIATGLHSQKIDLPTNGILFFGNGAELGKLGNWQCKERQNAKGEISCNIK
ncbi:unnamed protein product [Brugia timori]|uniref:Protein amnionless n=1 Tax=Brugia timori TaxID=42155 RepID=A0A0R3QK47_9BILA|nr:unnamed protein product [Brugia timori]